MAVNKTTGSKKPSAGKTTAKEKKTPLKGRALTLEALLERIRSRRGKRKQKPLSLEGVPLSTREREALRKQLLKSQGGRCAICTKRFSRKVPNHLDHDHDIGEARGLLCRACNFGLGFFDDNAGRIAQASQYVLLEHDRKRAREGEGVKARIPGVMPVNKRGQKGKG